MSKLTLVNSLLIAGSVSIGMGIHCTTAATIIQSTIITGLAIAAITCVVILCATCQPPGILISGTLIGSILGVSCILAIGLGIVGTITLIAAGAFFVLGTALLLSGAGCSIGMSCKSNKF